MMKFLKIFLIIILFIPTNVNAKNSSSLIIMDYSSGRILYENNSTEQKLIASITKVMTCIIVLENCNIDEKITVGEEVLSSYGTNIYIEVGEIISIKDLLYGLMLRSGNDAAITLAINTLGEEIFIQKMNEKAQELEMTKTYFENSHGLDETTQNKSTAYDMALLARYAYSNNIYRTIIGTKKYKTKTNMKSYEWTNRMSLLTQYKNCVGGKNGYTPKAGKTLISYAKKDEKTFIIVSLNDNDIYNHHRSLYNQYFSLYNYYTIIDKKTFFKDNSIFKYDWNVKESFSYPLKEDELNQVSTLVQIINYKNEKKGMIIIKLNEIEIGRINMYHKQKKDTKNVFQKIINLFTR